jgi:hypothetical protein
MQSIKTVAFAVFVSLGIGSPAFADVQLSIRDGHVSIIAKDATVRQILAEWARIGQTKIVNIERIPGGPITIELKGVSEVGALDVLLRRVSGYIAAPRATTVSNASRFDRIVVMPTSAPPPTPASAPRAVQSAGDSQPQSPHVQPQPADEVTEVADEQPSPTVMIPSPIPRPAPFNPSRQALEVVDPRQFRLPPQLQGGGVTHPTGAIPPGRGVARPGMLVQPPPQPGQPGVPGQPPVIRE